MAVTFVFGSAWSLLPSIVFPGLVGSHAVLYAGAADAAMTGGSPWTVGPPAAIFAGPPPMLLPYVGWVVLPDLLIRVAWVAIDAALAVWVIHRLALPAYWIAFPPLFGTILLGHPEILVLGLIVGGRALAGLAFVIKPYAVMPLLAERRWKAMSIGAATIVLTAPFLPWQQFLANLPSIIATLARQNTGDSTFGDPIWLAIGVVALVALGLRRACWLAVPVLWPFAQPNYKLMTIPALCPILAIAWAIPIPGFTLAGIVVLAILVTVDRLRPLPAWLQAGIAENARFGGGEWRMTRSLPTAPQAGAA